MKNIFILILKTILYLQQQIGYFLLKVLNFSNFISKYFYICVYSGIHLIGTTTALHDLIVRFPKESIRLTKFNFIYWGQTIDSKGHSLICSNLFSYQNCSYLSQCLYYILCYNFVQIQV